MKTRQANPGDAAAWLRMRAALWPDASRVELETEVAQHFAGSVPSLWVFICEDSGARPIGMLELSLRSCAEGCSSSPIPYVEGWYTEPQMRRRGVGRALMHAAECWARERGYSELASDTQLSNEDGARAHLGLGFEEVERAIHYRRTLD
jgi:aminoglycoside 6'-N-acetyltransferase I